MTPDPSYISALDSSVKGELDKLIEKFGAYVVGNEYADIIVLREHLDKFIQELTRLNIAIRDISWWCHATEDNKKEFGCPHGMGGPNSKHGWFSEIVQEDDEVMDILTSESVSEINEKALHLIKSKTMDKPYDPPLTFEKSKCLTPGLWLFVPDNWKRKK